jgi:hypothetical protein
MRSTELAPLSQFASGVLHSFCILSMHIFPDSKDEQSFSLVRRSKCSSWYDACPHFVAFSFQTGYDGWQGEIARSTHVLSKDVSGSQLGNNSKHLVPEAGALTGQSLFLACD